MREIERDEYQEEVFRLASLNDGLVAERDRLAAQLAAAERERDEALHAEDVAERYREAAEARLAEAETHARAESETNQWLHERVAALEQALRKIADLPRGHHFVGDPSRPWDTSYAITDIDDARKIARAALAAADRPTEGGEMDTVPATHDALCTAWTIIANVSGGDWTKQPQEWREAAVRWRDEMFHPVIEAEARRGDALADRLAADRPEGTRECMVEGCDRPAPPEAAARWAGGRSGAEFDVFVCDAHRDLLAGRLDVSFDRPKGTTP